MLRSLRKIKVKNSFSSVCFTQKQTFLTNEYKCSTDWNAQTSSPILNKLSLHDFYNVLDQNYSSKGLISAIDVDIFANAIKDPAYLEELKDLLHKLRQSAETGSTLESTHHATIRNFIEFGHTRELIEILQDPLNFGVFLDSYTANIILDKLITSNELELAANVASLVMLQEDFTNEITCTLCRYAAYKFITTYTPKESTEPPAPEPKNKKVEEIKIRVKYLRNPYFDDHFDLKDHLLLAGKTLAWISERSTDNTSNNLQIIGWLFYKKYDILMNICENVSKSPAFQVAEKTLKLLKKESEHAEGETKELLKKCVALLENNNKMGSSLEEAVKFSIENAINKVQHDDISQQKQLFKTWAEIRERKLEEQAKRLDRAKRVQLIEEKQKQMKNEEQMLWFFENEDAIDLEIEEKEKLETATDKEKSSKAVDENYIPPEILPKRK